MKIKDYKCKCGHDNFFFADKGNQTGVYCSYCGKWLKWADKDEQNLKTKPAFVLDEIMTEISELKGTFPKEYYLAIIDKYRKEQI